MSAYANLGTHSGARLHEAVVRTVIYALMLLLAATCILPFYSMIMSATHTNAAIRLRVLLWPGSQLERNYLRLIENMPIWRGFANSLLVASVSTVLSLYFSAAAAYAFSRLNFPTKKFFYGFIIVSLMVPGQLGIIGFFRLMASFQLLDTYVPLIVPSISNAFGVFFLTQNADAAIPMAVIESGRMDGCREYRIFNRLALPMLTPALATLGIFHFIGKWNSFLIPMIVIFDMVKMTLPVMIAGIRSQFAADYGAQYVGIAISVVPILLLFSFTSRWLIKGISAGALKY